MLFAHANSQHPHRGKTVVLQHINCRTVGRAQTNAREFNEYEMNAKQPGNMCHRKPHANSSLLFCSVCFFYLKFNLMQLNNVWKWITIDDVAMNASCCVCCCWWCWDASADAVSHHAKTIRLQDVKLICNDWQSGSCVLIWMLTKGPLQKRLYTHLAFQKDARAMCGVCTVNETQSLFDSNKFHSIYGRWICVSIGGSKWEDVEIPTFQFSWQFINISNTKSVR